MIPSETLMTQNSEIETKVTPLKIGIKETTRMTDQGVLVLVGPLKVLVTRFLVLRVKLQEECEEHQGLLGEREHQVLEINTDILKEKKIEVDPLLMIERDDHSLQKEIK